MGRAGIAPSIAAVNILFLDQFSDLGGAQQCLLDLIPAVHARGWRAFCGVPGEGPFTAKLRELGTEVSPISCGPYASGRKSVGDALRFARQQPRLTGEITQLAESARADLIYVNGPRVLPAAARAARGRWPLVFHCHSRPAGQYALKLVARALRQADADLIACSRFVAEPFQSGKVHVIYNGVTAGAPHRRQPPPWRIGMIGRTSAENGQAEFLQAARLLSQSGFDAVHVGDIGHSDASDAAILNKARDEERTVVTLDADFHTIMALSGLTKPSVIRIRIEGLQGEALAKLLQRVIAQCASELDAGAMVLVEHSRIRIRRLPLP